MVRLAKKSEVFINEFIITFGFLGGVFTRVGVDPESILLEALLQIMAAFIPSLEPFNPLFLILITAILTISAILTIWFTAKVPGLIAVLLAWISGFIILGGDTQTIIGLILLILAILLGAYATGELGEYLG